ncbi:hypothetical protein Q1695_006529 [Nippostrongylus brasiliensis]|nr:hypothetical protein Q1695_006529 [Nippostrongylus brasiliensis]
MAHPKPRGDADDSFNDSVHLDESWFYGPPKKRPLLKEDVKEVAAISPVRVKRTSLEEKSLGQLEIFSKQRFALAKLEEFAKVYRNSRVFSFEAPELSEGERRYVVTTLERFWVWYTSLKERHLYELIPENSPCRLYFDLEYSKQANVGIDHEDFLVLDSTTENKFSAHVICHLPNGVLFPSNVAIRPFAAKLYEALMENNPQKIWNSDGTKETVLFDTGVYTRNRNFRLFLSSKLGKQSVLKLAEYCSFYRKKKPTDPEIFYDSLCIPQNVEQFQLLNIAEENQNLARNPRFFSASYTNSLKEGSGPSPYPQLDEFILMVLRKWNHSAYFRHWKLVSNGGEDRCTGIIYYPGNCRYCFNIGREHKSNGTFWTVNFERNDFCQKCFDPECRGVSSNLFPLPSFIANSLKNKNVRAPHEEENERESTADYEDVSSFFDESYTELNEFFTQWDNVFDQ